MLFKQIIFDLFFFFVYLKPMKKYIYLLCILTVGILNSLSAQTRYYDIVLFGDTIGEISSLQKNFSDTEYELSYTSKAEAEVFFTHTKTFVQAKILYKDGFLNKAHIVRKKNDDFQEIDYKWENSKYSVTENGKKSIDEKKIYFCTTDFFFEEPVNVERVFVERLLESVDVQHLGNNQYLTKVDGGSNLYTYKNGVLQSLKSKKGISIFMYLRE